MNEEVRFFGNALRTTAEVIEIACATLDEQTTEAVAWALENGYRLVLLSDPGALIVALLDMHGRLGPVLASIDGRRGCRVRVYPLRTPETNGEDLPYRDRERRQPRRDGQALAAPALRA